MLAAPPLWRRSRPAPPTSPDPEPEPAGRLELSPSSRRRRAWPRPSPARLLRRPVRCPRRAESNGGEMMRLVRLRVFERGLGLLERAVRIHAGGLGVLQRRVDLGEVLRGCLALGYRLTQLLALG